MMEENGSYKSGISVSPQPLSPISSASDDQEDEDVGLEDVSLNTASASVTVHRDFNEIQTEDEGDENHFEGGDNSFKVIVRREEIHRSDYKPSVAPPPGQDSSTSDSDHSGKMSAIVDHGSRVITANGKKRKTVEDYAAQHKFDLISRSIIRHADDQVVRVLVCRFCYQSIGARSDRIKEHLASKRHKAMKAKAFRAASIESGRNMTLEEFSISQFLPEPSTSDMKWVAATQGQRGASSSKAPRSGVKRPAPGGSSNMDMDNTHDSPSSSHAVEEDQLLRIKWGHHSTNLLAMFKMLRFNNQLIDVFLWCEGKTIKCHKLVLAAGSTYFENLFKELTQANPVIFLKDMHFWTASALVEFIYDGEVRIPQSRIPVFVQAAESLQIKGLTSDPTVDDSSTSVGSSGVESSSPIRRSVSVDRHSDLPNNHKRATTMTTAPPTAVVHGTSNGTSSNAGNSGVVGLQNNSQHHQCQVYSQQNQGQTQNPSGMVYGANYVNSNYPNYQSGSSGGHYGDILTLANNLRNSLTPWYHQPLPQTLVHPNYRLGVNANVSNNRSSYSAPQTPNGVLPANYPAAYVQVQMSVGGNHTVPTASTAVPYTNNTQGDTRYFQPAEESEQELEDEEEEDEEPELPQSSQSGHHGAPGVECLSCVNPHIQQNGNYTANQNQNGFIKEGINGANKVGNNSDEIPSQSRTEMLNLHQDNGSEEYDEDDDDDTEMN